MFHRSQTGVVSERGFPSCLNSRLLRIQFPSVEIYNCRLFLYSMSPFDRPLGITYGEKSQIIAAAKRPVLAAQTQSGHRYLINPASTAQFSMMKKTWPTGKPVQAVPNRKEAGIIQKPFLGQNIQRP